LDKSNCKGARFLISSIRHEEKRKNSPLSFTRRPHNRPQTQRRKGEELLMIESSAWHGKVGSYARWRPAGRRLCRRSPFPSLPSRSVPAWGWSVSPRQLKNKRGANGSRYNLAGEGNERLIVIGRLGGFGCAAAVPADDYSFAFCIFASSLSSRSPFF
jgi:hypothetical protein